MPPVADKNKKEATGKITAAAPKKNHDTAPPDTAAMAVSIGRNLRRLRTRHGYSLERLAAVSGVSRAMLGQIELGKSVPTISLLWKVAHALEVPFSALNIDSNPSATIVLRGEKAKVLTSADGSFSSRALFPHDGERTVEFYEVEIAVGAAEHADAHAPGTMENLIVTQGDVEIIVAGESHILKPKDAFVFQADVAHTYRNVGTTRAVLYLVMSYAESIG